jgi:hypothetical protein
MTQGRQATPSVLRLLQGTARPNTAEDRGDRPKVAGEPELPPGVTLTADEKRVWDYLLRHIFVPGAHGTGDGIAFLNCVRLYMRAMEADQQTARLGSLVRLENGRVREAPWVKTSRETWSELRRSLAEIGGTPAGRARNANGPTGSAAGAAGGWAELGPPRGQRDAG